MENRCPHCLYLHENCCCQHNELSAANRRRVKAGAGSTPANGSLRHWGVLVEVDGEDVLCIESNSLSGKANIEEYAEEIRTAAKHLLAFIGDGGRSGASENSEINEH